LTADMHNLSMKLSYQFQYAQAKHQVHSKTVNGKFISLLNTFIVKLLYQFYGHLTCTLLLCTHLGKYRWNFFTLYIWQGRKIWEEK